MADGAETAEHGPAPARDPEWAGWQSWIGDRFEDHTGPFYFREEADGTVRCAFRAGPQHMNGGGHMHGGCMLTFADYSLFMIGLKAMETGGGVTVSLNGEFIGPAMLGELVESTGEVTRAGGSLVFMRGMIRVGDRPVMSFSGVVKRMKRGA
jgi:acyl-coenzyme A thioesterase PaaI-like protein